MEMNLIVEVVGDPFNNSNFVSTKMDFYDNIFLKQSRSRENEGQNIFIAPPPPDCWLANIQVNYI